MRAIVTKSPYAHALVLGLLLVGLVMGCGSTKDKNNDVSNEERALFANAPQDTVAITDPDNEYEIIIIEPGFNVWLNSFARPEGYYSQDYMENRNRIYVTNWNQRVLQPMAYDPNLYEQQINYDPGIDYGYEVNYKLYNYFIYFQRRYRQRLGPWVPRI